MLPLPRPGADPSNGTLGAWTQLPPLAIPARDAAGNLVAGKQDGPPLITFGCHFDQVEAGIQLSSPKFDDSAHCPAFKKLALRDSPQGP